MPVLSLPSIDIHQHHSPVRTSRCWAPDRVIPTHILNICPQNVLYHSGRPYIDPRSAIYGLRLVAARKGLLRQQSRGPLRYETPLWLLTLTLTRHSLHMNSRRRRIRGPRKHRRPGRLARQKLFKPLSTRLSSSLFHLSAPSRPASN